VFHKNAMQLVIVWRRKRYRNTRSCAEGV